MLQDAVLLKGRHQLVERPGEAKAKVVPRRAEADLLRDKEDKILIIVYIHTKRRFEDLSLLLQHETRTL